MYEGTYLLLLLDLFHFIIYLHSFVPSYLHIYYYYEGIYVFIIYYYDITKVFIITN